MTAKWLPVEGGIVPLGDPSGPTQKEERFARLQGALEDARGEYHLRRYDAAEARLGTIFSAAEKLRDGRYNLLAASAYCLQGRIHWRRAERALETHTAALVEEEHSKQDAAFRSAIKLFQDNQAFITADLLESRRYTDYAIALYRTEEREAAIEMLQRAQATGVMAAESFAYLGMVYRDRGELKQAVDALQKGLQLAPGDKVLLETLAMTLEDAGSSDAALRTYCKAAVAAGKDEDRTTAQRLLRAALKIKPDDAQALSMLTLLLHSQNDDTAAKELLDATLEKFPMNSWALGLRGMILRDHGNTEAALADFDRAQVDSPDLAWIALEHAQAVAGRDAWKARKLVRQASQLLDENDVRVAQARVQIQVQNAVSGVSNFGRKAIDWLRAAAEKAAKSQPLRRVMELGPTVLLERLDELAKSVPEQVELLTEIINRWPDRVEPREALAARLLQQGNYAEAIAQAEAALALAPDSASLLGLKAKALDRNGDLAEAVRFYRRASRAERADDDRFDDLIGALIRANRSEEA